jgi:exodeoxyribonuclease VII small subunit
MPKKTLKETAGDADIAAMNFETAYAELDAIVAQLDQGELTLEASLALHARGQALAAHCAKQLEQAELKVKEVRD